MAEDNSDRFSLSRRKALAGLGGIGAATALGGIGTLAQFTDTEENVVTFTAGGLDGTIEWSGSYNSEHITSSTTHVEMGDFTAHPEGVVADVHFSDIKPGDYGCVNFGIEVTNNPAWVASCLGVVEDIDYLNYEPEAESGVDVNDAGVNVNSQGALASDASYDQSEGELAENIYALPYYDSDGTCQFFDPDGTFTLGEYSVQTPSAFWSNSQDGTELQSWSATDDGGTEYYLAPRSLQDISQNIRALNTSVWNADGQTFDTVSAPAGASVGAGCVMLDGEIQDSETSNNTQGVSPLPPNTKINFGYDFHFPFGVGNEAQGDSMTMSLGFKFLQTRHTEAPDFGTFSPGSNTEQTPSP